jgi:hypothetical protein
MEGNTSPATKNPYQYSFLQNRSRGGEHNINGEGGEEEGLHSLPGRSILRVLISVPCRRFENAGCGAIFVGLWGVDILSNFFH